ncbi:MAG: tetratricopeptide repeat protein, partial [Longimicrobiales bacterium]|nr:tetratricopeptide repeat protein [Longimicrobiales bacterium]
MRDFFQRLRQRKVVRWAIAYAAAAWVVIEVAGQLGDIFGVPVELQRALVVVLAFGLIATLVLAWYHGERGRQHVGGTELVLLAAVLGLTAATLSLLDLGPEAASEPTPAGAAPSGSPSPRSVAILPFTDLSARQDQAYFSDGIAEELRSTLARVQGLRVASSTSSLSVEDRRLDPREIGRRLGVAYLVEGSVRKSAERLRVDARLVNVADGFHEWTASFDGVDADIFAVQDSIARAVARAFEVGFGNTAGPVQPRGQTADHVAQDLYLRGRFAWNRRSEEDLEAAVEYFQQALERDPSYGRALVGLADAYAVLGFYDYRPPSEAFPLAQDAARRALALESSLSQPHATLGYAALYHDWDWLAAEEHFRTAIRLDPGNPVAHQWYANHLTAMGRFEEALQQMRMASELDPLSMIAFSAIGWIQLYARRYQEAIDHLEDA